MCHHFCFLLHIEAGMVIEQLNKVTKQQQNADSRSPGTLKHADQCNVRIILGG